MKVFRGIPAMGGGVRTAVAIGNFDGVHLGHQALLKDAAGHAARSGGAVLSAALTFEPHPREFFRAETLPARICTLRDKASLIAACGIDLTCFARFCDRLARMTPEEFVLEILVKRLRASYVAVGGNFTFGDRGRGSAEDLARLCAPHGIEVRAADLLTEGSESISSSRLRDLLARGELAEARRLLGHAVCITGRVLHGAELGRTLGFPTLNIRPLPPGCRARPALDGVFAVKVHGLEPGRGLFGVCSMGNRPTVGRNLNFTCETNVLDWSGDAYGKMIRVEFLERLRGNRKFPGLEALREAIRADEAAARRLLSLQSPGDRV